jgi:hypothetical protein
MAAERVQSREVFSPSGFKAVPPAALSFEPKCMSDRS